MTAAERQAAYRARERAKLAAMKAALEKASADARGASGAGKSEAEVLDALARIERVLSQQSERLTAATRVEHSERILRRLTALERLVRGDPGLAVVPKATRRRPLGA